MKRVFTLLDRLAHIRTTLSSERTFLAYQRTALAQFAAGATFIHFFDNLLIRIIGALFIVTAVLTIVLGTIRYRKTRENIRRIEKNVTCDDDKTE